MAKIKSRESWGRIRKLRSGRLQAGYIGPDGQNYTARTSADKPLTFDTLTDARGWLSETRRAIQRDEWVSPIEQRERAEADAKRAVAERFGTYAATWISQRTNSKGEPLRSKTRTEYERQLTDGLATFANDRLRDITPARVRDWHAKRRAKTPTAAGADARVLRAILNTAVTDGAIDRNPVETQLTRTRTGRTHRPPTLDELRIILATIKQIEPRFHLAVLLAAYGGLRLSEWRALRRADIVTDNGRIRLQIARQAQYITGSGWEVGPPKSAEGVRVVTLPSWMADDVQAHLAEHVGKFPDSLLFDPPQRLRPNGEPYARRRSEFLHDRAFNDAWNPARDAAGVRQTVREHDLRAFAATTFAQSGATLRETQAFLGHSTVQAAMVYQHVGAEDRLDELADRMPHPTDAPTSNVTRIHVGGK